jgi:hypothetical protein
MVLLATTVGLKARIGRTDKVLFLSVGPEELPPNHLYIAEEAGLVTSCVEDQ